MPVLRHAGKTWGLWGDRSDVFHLVSVALCAKGLIIKRFMDRELIKTLAFAVVRKIAVTFLLTDLSLELEVGSKRARVCVGKFSHQAASRNLRLLACTLLCFVSIRVRSPSTGHFNRNTSLLIYPIN